MVLARICIQERHHHFSTSMLVSIHVTPLREIGALMNHYQRNLQSARCIAFLMSLDALCFSGRWSDLASCIHATTMFYSLRWLKQVTAMRVHQHIQKDENDEAGLKRVLGYVWGRARLCAAIDPALCVCAPWVTSTAAHEKASRM